MEHTNPSLPVILLYNLDRSWSSTEIAEIDGLVGQLSEGLAGVGHPTTPVCLEGANLESLLCKFDSREWIVLNWCEEIPGLPHSSPLVTRQLDALGFTYTGADSQALQFCDDKPCVKEHLRQNNLPIPSWQLFRTAAELDWDCFPAIVKPAYEHCSIGITHEAVVHNLVELQRQVARTIETYKEPVLVEDFIDGREFHVTVVGNGRLKILPVAEMDFSRIGEDFRRVCTYESKFVPASQDYQMIELRLPAPLTASELKRLEEISIGAYRATNCQDYARLDIRQRDGQFYVLDVNPNADISPDTSVVLAAELAGYSYGQFGSLLVNLAAHRHPTLASHKTLETLNQDHLV